MAWPIQVARNAPAMPRTVVRMNPVGLFGPGDSIRAMIPATKPTMMIQIMPLMAVVLSRWRFRAKACPALGVGTGSREENASNNEASRFLASNPFRQFAFVRQPSVRRQMIDHVGQILAEAFQQFVARQAGLRCDGIDLVGAERVGEIAGRNRLVLALADP